MENLNKEEANAISEELFKEMSRYNEKRIKEERIKRKKEQERIKYRYELLIEAFKKIEYTIENAIDNSIPFEGRILPEHIYFSEIKRQGIALVEVYDILNKVIDNMDAYENQKREK